MTACGWYLIGNLTGDVTHVVTHCVVLIVTDTNTTSPSKWIWPSNDEINDFPDPLGFEAEWKPWPGTMADPDGSVLADIFVRELIQNSWDSIQERTRALPPNKTENRGVVIREVRHAGRAAQDFCLRFGLGEHAARFKGMSSKHRMDSRLDDSTVANGEADSITLLVVSERGGMGMWGPWTTGGKAGVVSRLKSALIQTKSEKQNAASGGSWGHGKKGIANASMCRTLAVYTCSDASPDDVDDEGHDITRRFLGVSYWRSHDLDDRAHVGLGLLGLPTATGTYLGFKPFENDEADALVGDLAIPGLEVRSDAVPGETGVDYLIVEPSFSLEQLTKAIVRNWWPLLLSNPGAITVIDQNGNPVSCAPNDHAELAPFIRAFRLAVDPVDPEPNAEATTTINDQFFGAVGRLGLTSDVQEDGWSFEDPDNNATLVALIRNDMVIAYQRFPLLRRGKPPFVRGAFVVDRHRNEEASEGLKMSEPHLHNEWTSKRSPSVPQQFAALAQRTLAKIATEVTQLKARLRDDVPTQRIHFREFSRNWSIGRTVSTSKERIIDPRPPRAYSIVYEEPDVDANVKDPTLLRVTAKLMVKLAAVPGRTFPADGLKTSIELGWGVLEELGPVRDSSLADPSTVTVPAGFTLSDGKYVGKITDKPAEFVWTSMFFPDDWQVVAYPVIEEIVHSVPGDDDASQGVKP